MRIALVLIALVLLSTQAALAYVPGVAAATEPYIVLPSYLYPVLVKPGESFSVVVRGEITPSQAMLVSHRSSHPLALEERGRAELFIDPTYTFRGQQLRFRVPSDAADGLYMLMIRHERGLLWMPNAVIVDRAGGPRESIRIVHVTDTHFGAEQGGYPNNFKHTRYIALLNTLVEKHNVKLIVYTGDLIDVGTDVQSYRDFFSATSQIMAPQLALTGNHDWSQVVDTRSLVEMYYGRYIVPFVAWNFSYGDFMFVAIDTKFEGYPEMWQLDWLERTVAGSPHRAVIILMHHPYFSQAGTYKGKPEDIRGSVYSSWRTAWEQGRRFIEIVEKYKNIVAVLAGHVHRDADAIYERADGSRVHFITTVTSNHGYPAGFYWGVKLLEIRRSGEVRVLIPGGRSYSPTAGSINTESFLTFELRDSRSTAVSWFWNNTGFADVGIEEVVLPFYLNKTVPMDSYRIFGSQNSVRRVERYDLGLYYLFKVYADLRSPGKLTIASYEDRTAPRIELPALPTPALNRPFVIMVQATDEGWGVESVFAEVKLDGKTVARVNALRTVEPSQFRLLYVPRAYGVYEIVIRAVDLAGNAAERSIKFSLEDPEKPTPSPTPSPTPTPTPAPPPALPTETPSPISPMPTPTETRSGDNMFLNVLIVLLVIALAAGAVIAFLRR
ncbi:MAG: metallophosphoesterase [Acidilobaceae archaeon]|nr:metallophosphoesterase [Acidilobaceae archaeon]